jgi:cytochrome c-type biogenesis protein CcmH/NrfG
LRSWRFTARRSPPIRTFRSTKSPRARRADRAGAFTALRNALLLDGRRAQTYLALGKLLFDTGWVDDALRCFARAVALDPTLARPYPAEDGGQD